MEDNDIHSTYQGRLDTLTKSIEFFKVIIFNLIYVSMRLKEAPDYRMSSYILEKMAEDLMYISMMLKDLSNANVVFNNRDICRIHSSMKSFLTGILRNLL